MALILLAVLLPTALAFAIGNYHIKLFYDVGNNVLHGISPYGKIDFQTLAQRNQFVYPAFAAIFFALFALLPFMLGTLLLSLLNTAAIILALRISQVKSLWVYALVLTSFPVYYAILNGSIMGILALGIALAFKYKDKPYLFGLIVAILAGLKVILFGLMIYALLSKRYLAASFSFIFTTLLLLGSWALIGFDSFVQYPKMLSLLAQAEQANTYSLVSLLIGVNLSAHLAQLLSILAAAGLVIYAKYRANNSQVALALVVLAILTLTPVVWLDYAILIIICFAIKYPTFNRYWLICPIFWLIPALIDNVYSVSELSGIIVFNLLIGLMTFMICRPEQAILNDGDE